MKTKSKAKATDAAEASGEDWRPLLKTLLVAAAGLERAGGALALTDDEQWQILGICREAAKEPGDGLARLLAGPALATIPIIGELLLKTEVALQRPNLSQEHRRQIEALADQLDLALTLSYRKLGHLISWRGRFTRNSDLFAEAMNVACGDAGEAAWLIARCPADFPDEVAAGSEGVVDMFAWDTYQRVEALDELADEFPAQVATAAAHMHGWPMLRHRHRDSKTRFETLAERLNLGAEYPLDTSKAARFRPETPMVRYLDSLVHRLHYLWLTTKDEDYESIAAEDKALQDCWWHIEEERAEEEVLAVLRGIRSLPALSKATVKAWVKKVIVPLIMVTDARDYRHCEEPALKVIAKQNGVKSVATFESRLLAAVVPTLKSMSRPD